MFMKVEAWMILFFLPLNFLFGQTKDREKMEEWMIKSGIELNNPKVPEGFKSQLDCKNRPMYRKDNGDTIILYTWGGSIAEDLKTFKKSTNQVGFNIYRYPVKVQNNGTVVVNRMAKQTYVWRSD